MKLAIIGTHGIGKTTLALMLGAEAQRRGKSVHLINEVARSSPFPLNSGMSVDCAQWIITSQINKELNAKAQKAQVVVCDRSAYDPICYLEATDCEQYMYEKLEWYAEEWMKTYDYIIFVLPTLDVELIDDGVRSMDRVFQETVHEQFCMFVARYEKDYKKKNILPIHSSDIFNDNLKCLYNELFK